jgi:hypothetical protein
MRFISTKTHGYLDYLMGALLILAPWLLNFYQGGAESWVPIILGASVIIYSLFTDYELSVSKSISMKTHLTLDIFGGVLLLVSPWLFGFSDYIIWPHVVFGTLEIIAGLTTHYVPDYKHHTTSHSV